MPGGSTTTTRGGRRGGGGGTHFTACISHVTIDHHLFGNGAPFLLLKGTPSTVGRSLRFFHILQKKHSLLSLSPSSSAVCSHHLSARIVTVSRYDLQHRLLHVTPVYNFHLSLLTHSVSVCTVRISHHMGSTFVCVATREAHLLPPPPDYWYVSFSLAGPGPLHENAVSAS